MLKELRILFALNFYITRKSFLLNIFDKSLIFTIFLFKSEEDTSLSHYKSINQLKINRDDSVQLKNARVNDLTNGQIQDYPV